MIYVWGQSVDLGLRWICSVLLVSFAFDLRSILRGFTYFLIN